MQMVPAGLTQHLERAAPGKPAHCHWLPPSLPICFPVAAGLLHLLGASFRLATSLRDRL